jgi:hypothetical protein
MGASGQETSVMGKKWKVASFRDKVQPFSEKRDKEPFLKKFCQSCILLIKTWLNLQKKPLGAYISRKKGENKHKIFKFSKNVPKYEKNVIFTSLLFFTLGKLCSGAFLPLIDPVLILGDSAVDFPTPLARLVVSTLLCIYILIFMLLWWIAGPVGTQKSNFPINAGLSRWDSISTWA